MSSSAPNNGNCKFENDHDLKLSEQFEYFNFKQQNWYSHTPRPKDQNRRFPR